MVIGLDASRAWSASGSGIHVYATQVCGGLIADPPAPLRLYWPQRRPPAAAPPLAPGSRWRCIPLPRGWTRLRLRLEVARHPPAVLFVPAYRLPPGRLPRAVVAIQGLEHRLAAAAYPPAERRALDSFVADSLRRASAVVVPSETTRRDLVDLFDADPEQLVCIPHAPRTDLPTLTGEQAAGLRAPLALPAPYLLAVGGQHPRKNLPFLAGVLGAAAAAGCGAGLVCTAVPAARAAALGDAARAAGVAERVRCLPHADRATLAALYQGALAVVIPSLYEGFGLPAVEAMAQGVPVLANDVGAVREVAAGAAWLVPVADRDGWRDAVVQLAADPALRIRLRAEGRRRAAGFSWAASVAAHRRLPQRELALSRAGAGPPRP